MPDGMQCVAWRSTAFSNRLRFVVVLCAALLPQAVPAQVMQDGIFRFHKASGCGLDKQENSQSASFTLGDCFGTSFPGSGGMNISVELKSPELSGTLIPNTFLLQLVDPITTRASATITGKVFNDSSREPYSVTLEVTTFNAASDVGITPAQICRKEVRADNVKANASVTLTASNECTWSQLGLGFNGEGGPVGFQRTRVEMTLRSKNGFENRYGGEIQTLYAFLPRIDELKMNQLTPNTFPLIPDTEVDFSGRVYVLLRTRRRADLALRLFDTSGTLVGSTDFIRINSSFTESEHTMALKVKIPGTARLDLKAVLIDPLTARVIKETAVSSNIVANRCSLEGMLKAKFAFDTFWLPDVPVELIDTSTNAVVATTQSKPDPQNPAVRSFYCFNLPSGVNPGKQYRLRVRLHDQDAPIKSKLMIFDKPDATSPSEILWKPFGVSSTQGNRRDLIVGSAGDLDVPDPLGTVGAAATYWHVWRQIHEVFPKMFPGRQLTGDLPLEVYLNGTPTSYYCSQESRPVCPSASSIVLFRDSSLPGSHPDVVWHEFGHHVIRELYGIGFVPDGNFNDSDPLKLRVPHGGFSNSYTGDSMNEGFASYWAALSNQILDGSAEGIMTVNTLSSTALNPTFTELSLEQNWPAWHHRRTSDAEPPASAPREELAIAGILWDLIDTPSDPEPAPDVQWPEPPTFTPRDSITVEPKLIAEALAAEIPNTLLGLRTTLINRLPSAMTSVDGNPRKSGLSQLDEIFVMHRAFHDTNGDWKYQPGETIGKAANSVTWLGENADAQPLSVAPRPWRENIRPIRGSNIQLDLKDKNGVTIDAGEVKVSLEFGAGFEHLNSTRIVPVQRGLVYFEMPPDHYPARAVITVPGATNEPLVIENSTYWSSVAIAGDHFATKTFVLPSPAVQSLQPASGAVGSNIIITGNDFSATTTDNRVTFGDLRAQVVAATTTQLTVTVPGPLATGVISVTATVAGRTSNALTFTVTVPGIVIPVPALSFGLVSVGSTVDRSFTIRNTGAATLSVTSITVPGGFRLVTPFTPFSIATNGEQLVTIRFQPASAGDQTTDLIVKSNDAARPEVLVYATAIATPPFDPEIEAGPRGLNFGSVSLGVSRTVSLTVRNTGTAPLTINSTSSSNAQFTLTSPSVPFTIAEGQQTVDLRFTPTASGAQTGAFSLSSNDRDEATLVFQIRGDGVAAGGDEVLSTDDGTLEIGIAGNGLIIVNRLTPARYPATLKTIRLFLYQFTGLPSPAGAAITLIAFAEPSGGGTPPPNPTRLVNQVVTVPTVTTAGSYFDFAIANGPTINSGDFYIGFQSPNPAGGVVYGTDSSAPQRQRGWFSTNNGATFIGPLEAVQSNVQTPVNAMMRAVVSSSTASDCTWGIDPLTFAFGGAGGTGTIQVVAPTGCAWTATSAVPWIAFPGGNNGSGNGTLTFSVDRNVGAGDRSGILSVAGLNVTVTESAGRRRPVKR